MYIDIFNIIDLPIFKPYFLEYSVLNGNIIYFFKVNSRVMRKVVFVV